MPCRGETLPSGAKAALQPFPCRFVLAVKRFGLCGGRGPSGWKAALLPFPCRLALAAPLLAVDGQVGADAGQPAVDDRQDAQRLDLGEDLLQRRPHRADADESVDAVAAGEDLPEVVEPVGNALAGIRHAAEHQQRDGGPQEQQQRIFAVAEERRHGDREGEAGRHVGREEQDERPGRAVGRVIEEPVVDAQHVGARHDIDRSVDQRPARDNGQRRHAPPSRRAELVVEPELAPRAADHADADEHRLLDDDHDDRRHDEGSVTEVRVEEVVRLVDDGLRRGLRLRDVGPLGDQPLELDHGAGLPDRGHELLEYLPVHEEVARVAVDRHDGLLTAVEFLGVIRRDVDHAVDLAVVEEPAGLLHVGGLVGHIGVRTRVEGLDQAAARRRAALVHHADGDVAQHLRPVGQRIGRGVDQQRKDENQHDAAVGEDRAVLVAHDRQQLLAVGFHLSRKAAHATVSPRISAPCRPV